VFAVSGVNFPIGVLLYWLTTNVWSMGQQFYVIRRMPAPGSPAEKALNERRAKRGKPVTPEANGSTIVKDATADDGTKDGPLPGQRVQPKKQPKRKRTGPKSTGPSTGPSSGPSTGPSSGPTRSKFTET
jgi:YidC/Oxa1 family membrane protein insertase